MKNIQTYVLAGLVIGLAGSVAPARADEAPAELSPAAMEILCERFPLNSRCAGGDAAAPMSSDAPATEMPTDTTDPLSTETDVMDDGSSFDSETVDPAANEIPAEEAPLGGAETPEDGMMVPSADETIPAAPGGAMELPAEDVPPASDIPPTVDPTVPEATP